MSLKKATRTQKSDCFVDTSSSVIGNNGEGDC